MRTMFKLSCGVGSVNLVCVNQTMDTGHLSQHCADRCVSTLTLHVVVQLLLKKLGRP